jgi:glucose/arabinose dehydrogenase
MPTNLVRPRALDKQLPCTSLMHITRSAFTLATLTLLAACRDDGVKPQPENPVTIALEVVQSGFASPLYVTAPPGDTDRLFVVERGGLIRIVEDGGILPTPFLDLTGLTVGSGEQGLLGLAFHPVYETNGHFYVSYTDASGDTHLARYTVSASPDVADAASAEPILFVDQPYSNHNGGMLAFGPDGMLYAGLGDGGSGGDPDGNGQDASTLLGSLLRLDVDAGLPYGVPADNPFVGHATYREEIWAYGLRNPWRFSFDRETDDLYIGDVGQNAVEEIDFQAASSMGGENYGWNVMEGTRCYSPSSGCSQSGLTLPVAEYGHSAGCSVTGGYVYRGSDWPDLQGRYFFGDFCSGWIRSFVAVDGAATDLQDHSADVAVGLQLASFGEDGAGELYVVSLGGTLYGLTGAASGS